MRFAILLALFFIFEIEAKFAKHPIFDSTPDEETDYLLGWAEWSSYSKCSRKCGGGVSYQLRRCLDHCSGPSSRYRICNSQPCERETRSDAEIECSLKNRHSNDSGIGDWWFPVLDGKQCTLVCRSEKEGSIRDFNTSLRDGSRCEKPPGIIGACLHGHCESVGCDFVIGSNLRTDQCGICGGDGKLCGKSVFAWKDTQQFSPCDKTCGPNSYRVSVSVCINTINNRVVPERFCADLNRPRPKMVDCPTIVCPTQWLESEWSSCSATCGSGLQIREVFCVETHSNNKTEQIENRKVDDHYCWQTKKPINEQNCAINDCPKWATGNWGICDGTCEISGIQTRLVECRQNDKTVDEILCRIFEKPSNSQKCYNSSKCANFQELREKNPTQNFDRFRFVAENPFSQWNDARGGFGFQEEPVQLLNGFSRTPDKTKPRFYPGVWSECSVSCGPGVRTRTVECVAFQGITSNVIKLPDYECEGETKPNLFQPCQVQACPYNPENSENDVKLTYSAIRSNFRWDYGEWGPCSESCLGGKQKSTLKCIDFNRKMSVPWSHCDAKQRPIDLWRECNTEPCPPAWEIGEWESDCSHSCGGGVRSRKVRCIRQVAKMGGASSTLILPDAQCPSPKPPHQEPCGIADCPATWRVDQWSTCTTSCGSGSQKRQVYCEKRKSNGQVQVFDPPNQCSHLERPPTVQLCNLGSCTLTYDVGPIPTVAAALIGSYADDSNRIDPNFDQSHPNHRKLTLNVGGMANLYTGISVKIKCPVKNFDRSKIIWTKDGNKIENNAHIKVSTNGALRIFHSRMEDAGIYACYANGAQGNVTLNFKHRDSETLNSDLNRTKPRITQVDEENKNEAPEVLSPNDVDQALLYKVRTSLENLGEYRFASLIKTIREPGKLKVDFQVGSWSPCNQQECGAFDGAQVRLVKCRVSLNHSSAYVDDNVCEEFGIQRPPSSKNCHNSNCPEWEASDWTDCSNSRCIKLQTSVQRREVKCVFPNGTDADFTLCSRKTRPKIKKECVNPNCTAEWKPSIWGKCSKQCGDAIQMRLLRCVWKGTKKAAGKNCDSKKRPTAIQNCNLRPCFPDENESFFSTQSNSSFLNSALDFPLSDEPFKKLQKWRGWRLYNHWDWKKLNQLDEKLEKKF